MCVALPFMTFLIVTALQIVDSDATFRGHLLEKVENLILQAYNLSTMTSSAARRVAATKFLDDDAFMAIKPAEVSLQAAALHSTHIVSCRSLASSSTLRLRKFSQPVFLAATVSERSVLTSTTSRLSKNRFWLARWCWCVTESHGVIPVPLLAQIWHVLKKTTQINTEGYHFREDKCGPEYARILKKIENFEKKCRKFADILTALWKSAMYVF